MQTTEPFTITMKAGEAEIVIFDQIGNSFLEEGLTAKAFAEKLRAQGQVRVINVRISSPGGAVPEALSIYNTLRNHGAKVITHNEGFALSAASLILMAGDEVRMAEGTWLMIHNVSLRASGDHAELRRMAELSERFTGSMADIYAKRTGQTREAILSMMAEETWLDATEAKAKGFANTITPELKVAAHFDPTEFRNVPSALLEMREVPTMPTVTVTELKTACPGASNDFIVAQMEAGASVPAAQTAWMAEQQRTITALQSKKPASGAGVEPLAAGRGVAAFDGDAVAEFQEAVVAEMKQGFPRSVATARVCRQNPELRVAFVTAHNARHARR